MAIENPTWGAPRIHSELEILGYKVAPSTVAKYLQIARERKPPSQGWRKFLRNHVSQIASCDFFTVPTATFRVLYVFIVLLHDRRKVVHFNVTTNPTAEWAANQIVQAFPWDTAPKYLLRDRDGIYGDYFRRRVKSLGIKEVRIATHSPWQSPYVERLIRSIRDDCLDHVIVLGENHLWRILTEYFAYYHADRVHMSLGNNAPIPARGRAPGSRPRGRRGASRRAAP